MEKSGNKYDVTKTSQDDERLERDDITETSFEVEQDRQVSRNTSKPLVDYSNMSEDEYSDFSLKVKNLIRNALKDYDDTKRMSRKEVVEEVTRAVESNIKSIVEKERQSFKEDRTKLFNTLLKLSNRIDELSRNNPHHPPAPYNTLNTDQ